MVLHKEYIEKNEIANFKQKSGLMRIYLLDIIDSWLSSRIYKLACFLDYYCFYILYLLKTKMLEQNGW